MRHYEERAEARRAMAFAEAVRQAVPACLADSPAQQAPYKAYTERQLRKANGLPDLAEEKAARVTPSKDQSKKDAPRAARTSPASAMKPKTKSNVNTPAP